VITSYFTECPPAFQFYLRFALWVLYLRYLRLKILNLTAGGDTRMTQGAATHLLRSRQADPRDCLVHHSRSA
jgi:hypothetical protein